VTTTIVFADSTLLTRNRLLGHEDQWSVVLVTEQYTLVVVHRDHQAGIGFLYVALSM